MERALENYIETKDIKRVMLQVHKIDRNFVIQILSKYPAETTIQCLQELIKNNRANLQLVIEVANLNYSRLGISPIV